MNLPNKLTLSRVIIIPFFLAFLSIDTYCENMTIITSGHIFALMLFITASITDYYDGKIAREYGLVTNFGKLFDPLADKLLVIGAFLAFIESGIYPHWLIFMILAREFIITGLRTLAAQKNVIISASRSGKNKTISQMTTIICTLLFLIVRDLLTLGDNWSTSWDSWTIFFLRFLLVICVFFTMQSGFSYLWKNRSLLREQD